MTEKTRYADRLLEEFESICEENNIEYKVAWGPENYGTGVIMTPSNCQKFMKLDTSDLPDNRALESWSNSPNFPTPTVRYVGTDSLCYNVLDYPNYMFHGIFVEINILRGEQSSFMDRHYYDIAERGIYLKTYNFTTQKRKKTDKKLLEKYRVVRKLAGGTESLKKKTLAHILKAEEVSLDSNLAEQFKVKTYSKMYTKYTIVDDNLNSQEFFENNQEKLNELTCDELKEVRKCKRTMDKARWKNNQAMSSAKEAWGIICRVDDEIKGIHSDEIEE